MNKFTNKFLLTRNKFMPELHLKQPGLNLGKIQKFRETSNLKHLYRNEEMN